METEPAAFFTEERKRFHLALRNSVLSANANGIPSNADKDSRASVAFASGILSRIGEETIGVRLAGQTSGNQFEAICTHFVSETFPRLAHLRPGTWAIKCVGSRNRAEIAKYIQYSHIVSLELAAKKDPALAAALGSDYTITPDIVIARSPEGDTVINSKEPLVDLNIARHADLRKLNNPFPLLHASISCKWTMRSDRAQNSRSEALNLIRNRKGRLPHIVVVTGEPLPSRIASIALGTGDIDCVYHFALPELIESVAESDYEDAAELLKIMTDGKRLKDISDLPLDLAV